ncbi:MAG: hypothetical protein DRI48_08645, partial [Chloroflexi bacterium]
DVSYGRMPDGGETWQFLDAPTPGWPNQGRPPLIGGTTHTPTRPTGGDVVTVTTVVTDEGPVTVTLWYRTFAPGSSPPDHQPTPMVTDGGNLYVGSIPARGDGAWVEYYVAAEDGAGMTSVDRPGWPQGDYRYVVGWQRPPLYVNELMALNTHTLEDEDGDSDDWIELYNAGSVDVDVGGMYLGDSIGNATQFTIPVGTVVPAGGYLILWADGDDTPGHLDFRLSGAGEYVGLFDSQANYYAPIDAVYFDPQTPDVSWGRFPEPVTGPEGGGESEWRAMDVPTPGAPNRLHPPRFLQVERDPTWPDADEAVAVTAVITGGYPLVSATLWYSVEGSFQAVPMDVGGGGTNRQLVLPPRPGGTRVDYYLEAVDSVGQRTLHPPFASSFTHRYLVGYSPPAVFINEFLADNESVNRDEAGDYEDWVELYNGSAVTVALEGMYLTDDLTRPTRWQFPAGTTIPPDGHLLVWCDGEPGEGALHTNFRLNRDGEALGLFDSRVHGLVPLDWIVFGPQRDNVSYGRRSDGGDAWGFLDPPTPGTSNG